MNGSRIRGVSNDTGPDDATASRAALFEDEKRRIIESCFTKREPDGSFAESYITHIRVTEDSASPSVPPPPDSPAENKKSRAIIVAVKRSGRVRLHKARENPQGTFSIGKTWVLDDLSAIESYTGATPTTYDEQMRKEWAGSTGVLLTIQKPYFWQIATQKEKDFFVGSLVKIYRKYTKGREPRLTGFTGKELLDFGVTGQPAPLVARTPAAAEPSPYVTPSPAASPYTDRNRNREIRPPSSGSNAPPTASSNYMRSPGTAMGGEDASSRFQKLRRGSNASSTRDDFRTGTPIDGSISSKFGVNSSKESLPQDGAGSSIASERPKPNGIHPAFQRNRDGGAFGRPPDSPRRVPSSEQPFTTSRSETPERRPGGIVARKASGSSDTREILPERRRPPLGFNPDPSTISTTDSPVNSMPKFVLPTTSTDRPEVDQKPRLSNEDTVHAMNNRPQIVEPLVIPPVEPPKDQNGDISNISQALIAESPADSPGASLASPEEHRPGLGPMIRKKKSAVEIANTFRRAATVANGFKPRAGGAASKLLRGEGADSPDSGDGIHGVFVARPKEPIKKAESTPLSMSSQPSTPDNTAKSLSKETQPSAPVSDAVANIDKRISDSFTPRPLSIPKTTEKLAVLEEVKPIPEKRKPLPDRSAHYAKIFDCDPALLEGRTSEIDGVLDDFGWNNNGEASRKTYEELQTDIRRDLASLETGNWLSVMENSDERVAQVSKLIDDAIHECDELDGLLTLYNVELGTLAEDVAYIEAQSQGLQVQTANQRLLQTELQNLLDTITIPEEKLLTLERSSHDSQNFLQDIGDALVHLYKAMITIDPSIRQDDDKEATDGISADVSNMRAVRDQKDKYTRVSVAFMRTFNEKMSSRFRHGQSSIRDSVSSQRSLVSAGGKIDHGMRNKFRMDLLYYSPIVLFEREVRREQHQSLLDKYTSSASDAYRDQFKNVTQAWQKDIKTSSGSDDVLFTTQEKEPESMARKLTVKRSKTVIKAEGPKGLGIERDQNGKVEPYVAFNGALLDLSQAILFEQNFVTEFFHLHSGQDVEFPDLVDKAARGQQIHTNLIDPRGYENDRELRPMIKNAISQIFPEWERTLRSTVDQIINEDPLNGFGILFSLQHRTNVLSGTGQDFLLSTLATSEEYLNKRIKDLIKDQVKAIDDQKVKLKKRKGVLSFIRIFPLFVKAIEAQLPGGLANHLPIRRTIDEHYNTINSHIFQSLKAIAKDSGISGMGSQKPHGLQGATDAEDKEILNYHILLIENTHHYLEDVPEGANDALDAGREIARNEMNEHLNLYISAILRRPLGKLLDFVESTESLIKTANDGPTSIASRASHSKSVFKRILSSYDSKEIIKGAEALKKRVNKHFAEADDAMGSQTLVAKVLRDCSERYVDLHDRTVAVIKDVYENALEIEFKREDIQNAFKRV